MRWRIEFAMTMLSMQKEIPLNAGFNFYGVMGAKVFAFCLISSAR